MSRLRQIEEVYHQVLQVPADERAPSLERLCGSDVALRLEVLSLLKHESPPEGFLAEPALDLTDFMTLDDPCGDDLLGREIGPYRIERRIASGGMGSVYQASRADGQFDRIVAVKVVKRGMDSEDILGRFQQERRTLASLDHPNIARLLDGGVVPDGRPYLVMEYVTGTPIDEYCDARHLSTAQRISIFGQVCDAVRFAHQNLVMHRDLKPGNILLTAEGTPKLLDFGIAKVIDGTEAQDVTVVHERRYTPEYASPEQVAGLPLTTSTDIYSLGVILYELLTGRRPYLFKTRSAAEIERVVRTVTPVPPSAAVSQAASREPASPHPASGDPVEQPVRRVRDEAPRRLRRRLRGDLDTIVLKALHKDPARRYASVEQFALDLERYLTGRPVIARPDSVRYRLRKFIQRHAAMTCAAGLAVAALAVGVASVVWGASAARRERDAAYLARDQAEATADFLQRMMASADPYHEGPETKVRTILDAASKQIDVELRDRPLLQAAVSSTIGRTYLGLGMLQEAEAHIRAAYELRTRLLASDDHDVAESEFDLAQLLYATGEFSEAESLLRQSLATHERSRGAENIDTARVWNDLGAILRAQGKIDDAEEALHLALAIRRKVAGPDSLEAAESLNNLAGALRARGDVASAEAAVREVLNIRRRRLRPEHPLVLQAMANLAVLLAERGDIQRAEEMKREVIALDRKVFGDEHPALATDLTGLGNMLVIQGRAAEAEPLLEEALRIRRQRLPPDDLRLLQTQVSLGRCALRLERLSEAESLLADALARAIPQVRPGDVSWLGAINDLASIYEKSGRSEKAAEAQAMKARIGTE